MKRIFHILPVAVVLMAMLPLSSAAQQLLIPAGTPVGLQLQDDTVTVAAFDDLLGANARQAGLRIGDEILTIQGTAVDSPEDVRSILEAAGGTVEVTVSRSGRPRTLHLEPLQSGGRKRLGVYLRQGVSGIGTVTWYDPDTGRFGTLGHGVSTAKGSLVPMTQGTVYKAEIQSVSKGRSGHPGQLKGSAEIPCGSLSRNTPQGVFGITRTGWLGEPLPVALWEEIHQGPAAIRSTVTGTTPREYSVELLKIYPRDRPDSRNFLLRVTDPALLTHTGGIVQGMSGSPVIQDGRIVGAVTHVLVNDPTLGYGIFIGNMLDAAA